MDEKHNKGTFSKLAVMNHFVTLGYYVYNEMSNTGPVDFVAINHQTKQVTLVEVKTASFRKANNTMIHRILKPIQKDLSVELVYYNIDTNEGKYA